MSKRTPKNVGRSIRERLLNIHKEGKHEYMYILQRYFNERLLYRVSVSKYRGQFLLKGGSLLYAHNGLDCRPTVDIHGIRLLFRFFPSVHISYCYKSYSLHFENK